MRILLLNYEFPPVGGGGGTAAAQIARHLARRGVEIVALTGGFRDLARREARDGYVIYRGPALRRQIDRCSVPEMGAYIAGALLPALRLARAFRPDLLHVYFGMPTGPVGLAINQLRGIPYLLSLRGGDVPGSMGAETAWLHRLTRPATRLVWGHAAALVVNSQGLHEVASRTVPGRTLEIVPNGVDLDLFHPAERALAPDGTLRLLFVGRLSRQKGVSDLLQAVGRLPPDLRQQVALELVGGGPEEDELRRLAGSLGLGETVHFAGWLPRGEVVHHYQQADVFVFPSWTEGMPNVLLEAMGCGRPILATAIPANRELVQDGVNGLLVAAADVPALADKLERLLRDEPLRVRMGRESRRRAAAYDWACTADRYLAISEEILARCPRRAARRSERLAGQGH